MSTTRELTLPASITGDVYLGFAIPKTTVAGEEIDGVTAAGTAIGELVEIREIEAGDRSENDFVNFTKADDDFNIGGRACIASTLETRRP